VSWHGGPGEREREIELSQSVTNKLKPEDIIFRDFAKSWPQFVNKAPILALPVVTPATPPPLWQPIVQAECIFSPDAGGEVPQVTLTWNEVSGSQVTTAAAVSAQVAAPSPAATRFDLTLVHDGFARSYYSTGLGSDKLKRFNLPANSSLAADTAAVLLTGPGLFPKLIDFRTETLRERDTNRPFVRRALVLRDFNPGLTYTIRRSTLVGEQNWDEDGRFAFLTPVCPNSF